MAHRLHPGAWFAPSDEFVSGSALECALLFRGCTASSLEEIAQSTVSNGVVTLEGDVDFWSQREDADRAVRILVGVGSVDNRIQIRSTKASREINDAIHDRVET
jgi:osmotically-inducible protein OsmY